MTGGECWSHQSQQLDKTESLWRHNQTQQYNAPAQWRGPGPITEEYCGHVTGCPPIRMLPRAVPHCNGDTVQSQPHNLAHIHAIKCSVQLQLCQLDKNNL